MPKKKLRTRLRFTPGPPTRAALTRYPLWCMALDEEERPGQDESTIRPSDDQERIDDTTAYVAAVAKTPSGATYEAMMEGDGYGISGTNDVEQITIWIDDEPVLVKILAKKLWVHRSNHSPLGYFNDQFLPLEVRAVVPGPKGKSFAITLLPDGKIRHARAPKKIPLLPPIVRPSDIPDGDRTILETSEETVVVNLEVGEDAIEGRTKFVLRLQGPLLVAREEYHNIKKDLRIALDVEYDARTLRVASIVRTEQGKRLTALRSGNGEVIPDDCFFDMHLPLKILPLATGWSVRLPLFRTDTERVDYALVTVEGIEAAPRHPGSRAWRVRVDGRGSFYHVIWFDVATRQSLATKFLSDVLPDKDVLIVEEGLAAASAGG